MNCPKVRCHGRAVMVSRKIGRCTKCYSTFLKPEYEPSARMKYIWGFWLKLLQGGKNGHGHL